MTRIDHAGKARQILAEIPDGATEAGTMAWCAEAQVHATLALVEQQRIANLIAMHQSTFPPEMLDRDGWFAAQKEIVAALGLTAGQEGTNDE